MTSVERGALMSLACAVQTVRNANTPFFVFQVNITKNILFRVGQQGVLEAIMPQDGCKRKTFSYP